MDAEHPLGRDAEQPAGLDEQLGREAAFAIMRYDYPTAAVLLATAARKAAADAARQALSPARRI